MHVDYSFDCCGLCIYDSGTLHRLQEEKVKIQPKESFDSQMHVRYYG